MGTRAGDTSNKIAILALAVSVLSASFAVYAILRKDKLIRAQLQDRERVVSVVLKFNWKENSLRRYDLSNFETITATISNTGRSPVVLKELRLTMEQSQGVFWYKDEPIETQLNWQEYATVAVSGVELNDVPWLLDDEPLKMSADLTLGDGQVVHIGYGAFDDALRVSGAVILLTIDDVRPGG